MKSKWESMTIDELFALRGQMQDLLTAKLLAKKVTLERQLRTLNERSGNVQQRSLACHKPSIRVQRAER
jgi:hypothetical protein